MKILVTGASGFIGKNLVTKLKNIKDAKDNLYPFLNIEEIFEYNKNSTTYDLENYAKQCDFVFDLASINRPKNNENYDMNLEMTKQLIDALQNANSKATIIFSSSIHAKNESEYGISKKLCENILIEFSKKNNSQIFIFRLSNIFGKWAKPNYNSCVTTFCYNIANDLPIQINDLDTELNLCYIDDVVENFINILTDKNIVNDTFVEIDKIYKKSLADIVNALYKFKKMRKNLELPKNCDTFESKLYSTYISYLNPTEFSYTLKQNVDARGSFTEFLHTNCNGEVSVNVLKPKIVKGQHWHNSKNEKFLVVSGNGVIRFRQIGKQEIIEYFVCGQNLEVVDIPAGYVHNIENLGDSNMVTIMWSNEIFDKKKPDTYFEMV